MITCEFENGNKATLRHAVVDNVVIKDGKILLAKRAPHLLEGGKWGLIGGYMERDETISQAVQREIHEETGYEVHDITLLRIIDDPNRPFDANRQNIAFVHFCTAGEKTGTADDESTERRWFPLNEIPADSDIAFDHASNIALYREYLKAPFALPRIG